MGFGFKYHVVTIVAIFFALTVGLVVGSLILSPHVVRTYDTAFKRLHVQLDQDIHDKNQEIDRYKKCLNSVMPLALSGMLAGKTVAIVQTGDYPDEVNGIRETLATAGAQVASVTAIERGFARPDELLIPALSGLHQDDPRVPTDRAGLASVIAGVLAHGDSGPEGIMPVLDRADLISYDADSSYTLPVGYVVLLSGSRSEGSNRPANVDQPLTNALQKLGITVMMCEPESAVVSDVPAYRSLGLNMATVDNIDSDIGKISLVFALAHNAKDDYGVKQAAANNLMPPPVAHISMISVLIPAYNESAYIAATVEAAHGIDGVGEVVVVDDGSSDDTAARAEAAGADVILKQRHAGKGAALQAGYEVAGGEVLLLLDADLGASAGEAQALLTPVTSGVVDMTIATFPVVPNKGGGMGLVVKLARWGIRRLTGRTMQSPLSGQRALRRDLIADVGGFAAGWGVEISLTVSALRAGYRVLEVPTTMTHRVTGRTPGDILHRAAQFVAAARVLARLWVQRAPQLPEGAGRRRG